VAHSGQLNGSLNNRGGIASAHSFRSSNLNGRVSHAGVLGQQRGFASAQSLQGLQQGRGQYQHSYRGQTNQGGLANRSSNLRGLTASRSSNLRGLTASRSSSLRGSSAVNPNFSRQHGSLSSRNFVHSSRGLRHSAGWYHNGSGHAWHSHWGGDYGHFGGGYGGWNDGYGSWDGDWCPYYDWGWHHRHCFFWDGAWVIGDYPCYGYEPGSYVVDPSPRYTVDTTAIRVQQALADQGYFDGAVDGIVGAATSEAIANYQNDHNLPVSGIIDVELMSSLGLQ
jgi:hypothetical protein